MCSVSGRKTELDFNYLQSKETIETEPKSITIILYMFGLFKKSGPKKASINSGQHEVTVEPNQNLLDAALKAGVNFPHDCRVGSCGSCTCKLTKGKIKKLTDFSYVLTLDQLNDGMILACQSRLKTDVNIEIVAGY